MKYKSKILILLTIVALLLLECEKPEQIVKVATIDVLLDDISYDSILLKGEIIDNGGAPVIDHGIEIRQQTSPQGDFDVVSLGMKTKTGIFSVHFENPDPGVIYDFRAYAKTKDRITYGELKTVSSLPLMVPELTTIPVSEITHFSGASGGIITNEGGSSIVSRGICWSTSENPTVDDPKSVDPSPGPGEFVNHLAGLSYNTTYFVRAYASNNIGIGYGNQVSFMSSPDIPNITTDSIGVDITNTTAKVFGTALNDGGRWISEKGVCYSINQEPTLSNIKVVEENDGTGNIEVILSGLERNSTYYVRAYATNEVGTAYGDELTLITDNNVVSDIDGNVYNVIRIGTQEWMMENLKTTRFNDGAPIPHVTNTTDWSNLSTPGYCYYNNDEASNRSNYGSLYNFYAVESDILCPTNWHVPTEDEWITLCDLLGGEDYAGGELKDTASGRWNSPNTGATNSSGYTGLPAGVLSNMGDFYGLGEKAYWWGSTQYSAFSSWGRGVSYDYEKVYHQYGDKNYGFSVRCIKD